MAPLSRIQSQLAEIYDLSTGPEVEDFLCDRHAVEAADAEPERGEVLLIAEDPEGAQLGLYVDPEAVALLERGGDAWFDGRLPAMSLATEGVSHFLFVMHRGRFDLSVSQLELELQAEVDKYALAVASARLLSSEGALRGFGAGLVAARSRAARKHLFQGATFLDPAGTEAGDRYRLAHQKASRFVGSLEDNFLQTRDVNGWFRSLRRFYRASLTEKLRLSG